MKKTILALPLCFMLAFCSSSKKPMTPAGISNVNIGNGDSMSSASSASSKYSTADRDYAYRSANPTDLEGTWTLDGMVSSSGTWSTTGEWYKDSTATQAMDTATAMSDDIQKSGARAGKKSKKHSARRALYDSANARLKREYNTSYVLDTTIQPYKYWQRIPTVVLNPSKLVFTGNTGCNSMSGSFNFDAANIKFGRSVSTSRMACQQYDETTFLSTLQKVDSYTLSGNTLELKQGNTLLMTFKKS